MSGFSYRLVVLTHGNSETLERTMSSFYELISPLPSSRRLYVDGSPPMDELEHHPPFAYEEVGYLTRQGSQGFCASTRDMWMFAGHLMPDEDPWEYVFWLEHDFEFTRPVDLTELAAVLDRDKMLSQVSLMRDAVSAPEKVAGGLFELRNGATEWERKPWGFIQADYVMTTNPSLMRRQFMAENPWPDHSEICEGLFGFALRERGFRGGVYGDGSVYVRHIGQRDGSGYGY